MASFRSRRVFARFCAPLLSNIQRCHFSQLSTQPRSVLFFGTDEFAVPSLEILASSPKVVEHIEVVCPIPTGRRHGKAVELPIRKLAEQIGLRVHDYPITPYTRSTDKFKGLDTLAANFDLGIAVSYGHLIPPSVIKSFRCGTLNVHPSALPRFRGSAPLQHTILQGDDVASVSIIELSVDRFDHGKILTSAQTAVNEEWAYADLHSKLSVLGAECLLQTVEHHASLLPTAKSQSDMDEQPCLASKVTKEMGIIRWTEWSMMQVHRVFRAIHHQVPVITSFQGKRIQLVSIATLKVCRAAVFSVLYTTVGGIRAGNVVYDASSKLLFVRCADEAWLGIKELRFMGKKILSAEAFANGYGVRKAPALFDDI